MPDQQRKQRPYSKYDYRSKDTDNSRNGRSSKTLKTSFGEVEVAVPRDRKGEFEPQLLKKHQTSISQDISGESHIGQHGAEPGLGGMAHGIPKGMDGRILWAKEPEGVPRMTVRMDGRALRLKTLGNAVCPPQSYPIFRYIAMIENGTCGDLCPYGNGGDST